MTLATARLVLRPLAPDDAPAVGAIARLRAVADTVISVPHPYPAGEAERFIAARIAEREAGRGTAFAIEAEGVVIGVAEVRHVDREHSQAELSFWLAPGAWGRGYTSEIVPALVAHGIDGLGLNRLYAYHMVRNPASGRVLEKAGFRREGTLRQRVRRWGRFEDVALWALLAEDR